MRAAALVACLAMVFSTVAMATIIDSEPNNTMATASNVGSILDSTDGGVCSLTPGDVDYFKVYLEPGYYLTAVTTPLSANFQVPDTFMGLLDSEGAVLVYDEDSDADSSSPSGYGSLIQYKISTAGTYYVAVTGFTGTDLADKDLNFDGKDDATGVAHTQSGNYSLIIGSFPVPEPATLSLLALAGLLYRKH